MSFIPRLPDTAPFSPAQRAWLDGFIAGLLTDGNDSPIAEPADQELPWHDPTLALDARLELAAGRRAEHRLMAAMAQLDCGQCGYLCETYAAAIASGSEASLSRCAPGGKATSRTLKELQGEICSPKQTKAPTVAAAAPAPVALPARAGEAPQFEVRLRRASSLHRAGAEKDTRHVVLKTVDRNVTYAAGDSLAVIARNCPDLVGAIIERLAAPAETPVQSPDGIECPLVEALS